MRRLSFAKLHWMLSAVADSKKTLRASELDRLIVSSGILRGRKNDHAPSRSTLYHYRTTLLRLGALKKDNGHIYANIDNPAVSSLIRESHTHTINSRLSKTAKDLFATLVLGNKDCVSIFFDIFMPLFSPIVSVAAFRQHAAPVCYMPLQSSGVIRPILTNQTTRRIRELASCSKKGPPVQAVPYGLRYWARDELDLIDEYRRLSDGALNMFPLREPTSSPHADSDVLQMANYILGKHRLHEWTLYSVYDLILDCCQSLRRPVSLLFSAIDTLVDAVHNDIVLIPTSRSFATMQTPAFPETERMELRRYYRYRGAHGPYISHLRVHRRAPFLVGRDRVSRPRPKTADIVAQPERIGSGRGQPLPRASTPTPSGDHVQKRRASRSSSASRNISLGHVPTSPRSA